MRPKNYCLLLNGAESYPKIPVPAIGGESDKFPAYKLSSPQIRGLRPRTNVLSLPTVFDFRDAAAGHIHQAVQVGKLIHDGRRETQVFRGLFIFHRRSGGGFDKFVEFVDFAAEFVQRKRQWFGWHGTLEKMEEFCRLQNTKSGEPARIRIRSLNPPLSGPGTEGIETGLHVGTTRAHTGKPVRYHACQLRVLQSAKIFSGYFREEWQKAAETASNVGLTDASWWRL